MEILGTSGCPIPAQAHGMLHMCAPLRACTRTHTHTHARGSKKCFSTFFLRSQKLQFNN